jgi:hypothetical protein
VLNNHTARNEPEAQGFPRDREALPNAQLIAEAFNVAHENGMGPRELADRLREAERELESMEASYHTVQDALTEQTAKLRELAMCVYDMQEAEQSVGARNVMREEPADTAKAAVIYRRKKKMAYALAAAALKGSSDE